MEQYIAFLISQGRNWINLDEIVNGYETVTAFESFKDGLATRFGLSPAAAAEMDAHRKIGAIKIIKNERNLGLKEAKDIVDAAQAANPGQWGTPYVSPVRTDGSWGEVPVWPPLHDGNSLLSVDSPY